MTVLLGCSMNSYANNEINDYQPSYGGADSTLISFNDLRLVNSKLIELDYEKQINKNLREIIANDIIIIDNYKRLQQKTSKDLQKAINQRNIFIGTTVGVFVVGTLVTTLLLVK